GVETALTTGRERRFRVPGAGAGDQLIRADFSRFSKSGAAVRAGSGLAIATRHADPNVGAAGRTRGGTPGLALGRRSIRAGRGQPGPDGGLAEAVPGAEPETASPVPVDRDDRDQPQG